MPTLTDEKQKVEKLQVAYCVHAGRYGGVCDEVATVRVSRKGVSVTLCDIHGDKYRRGELLHVVRCNQCDGACQPGYIDESRIGGGVFCNDHCRNAFHGGSSERTQYR